jgi:hypothetical protein
MQAHNKPYISHIAVFGLYKNAIDQRLYTCLKQQLLLPVRHRNSDWLVFEVFYPKTSQALLQPLIDLTTSNFEISAMKKRLYKTAGSKPAPTF